MKLRKKPLLILLTVIMATSAFATKAIAEELPVTIAGTDIITPQAEQTEWVYRYYNGILQKRHWSNTYARWLTDWINVG